MSPQANLTNRRSRSGEEMADVCILVEGCYPYVPGGVSSWIDWLMRSQPELTFRVVALWPQPTEQAPRYELPDNAIGIDHVYLQDFGAPPVNRQRRPAETEAFADALSRLMVTGGVAALEEVVGLCRHMRRRAPLQRLYNSPIAWELVERMYLERMPYGSFLHFFWAWRALAGGLLAVLDAELPPARVYHTISTGYAGLLAARARIETGRPALLTEHGIYTNERRIELLMADWVADTIDRGHQLDDPRHDLRDHWIGAFEAYARTCYEAATEIVTLYEDNQRAQELVGADRRRLKVIANGIDTKRYAGLERPRADAAPTMALIGRVVPIKDVKTFIAAAGVLAKRVKGLRALVLGPLDEDPAYVEECRQMVRQARLEGTVTFTGRVDVAAYLPEIHAAVLTSLSESQPLVILEAGAAGVPFVATNVGSCREILEGRADETPALGPGGIVTELVAPEDIADAVGRLLADPDMAARYGAALKARVLATYTSEQASRAYSELYARLMAAPDHAPADHATVGVDREEARWPA